MDDIETECAAGKSEEADLFADYNPRESVFDESRAADGSNRPAFAVLSKALAHVTPADAKARAETSRRLVREQGITYNVYGDANVMERPWELDPLPFVISPEEWRSLEQALIQRATLINRVLADCYGPQELIRSGRLPPALVFAQSEFLQPCHGVRPPDDVFLHFYACDLARSPDGRWWVISDRTQIPTGAGYALANRLVTSRIFAEAFRDCHVQRLAGFFRDVQHSLAALGRRRTDNPRIVLLTPGPYNETYFEQAYLARYLGYSLVEGQDLCVRDDRVFLKTLSGLEPVDVILRRVDDDFCDPLELRNDSMLGVPGLIEALRAGNVAVANALGSGLLQSPAFMAFLPGLCRHIFGEDLKLSSVATWWCGQRKAEDYVSQHLDELFVRPAFRSGMRRIEATGRLTEKERESLKRRLRFQPHLYVAQELIQLSTAPSIGPEGITPRRISLRAYLVANNGGYKVMPGGLTRVARSGESHSVSMQLGGASKDTWVLSEKPVEEVTLLRSSSSGVELRRVGNNLPSRMADNFFWLGRYTERADATARLLRGALARFTPESTGGAAMPVLTTLLATLETAGVLPPTSEEIEKPYNPEMLEAELMGSIFDPDRPGSLRAVADKLQRLAIVCRDRTSTDLYRVLANAQELLAKPEGTSPLLSSEASEILSRLLLNISAVHGLARENMTRAQGWRFLDMGCRIERLVHLCSMLEAGLRSDKEGDPSILEALLEVADSSITYRSRYNLMPNVAAVYDLLLLDDTNPRSVLFQFNQLVKHFDRLPLERQSPLLTLGQRILIEAVARVRLLDARELVSPDRKGETRVHRVLRQTVEDLPRLSDAIAVSYFAHSAISRAGGRFTP
jgi:uncharacterized circularly permuted ATP-grasp superfamily protein/uncharacterized alpha-E superfamily protein